MAVPLKVLVKETSWQDAVRCFVRGVAMGSDSLTHLLGRLADAIKCSSPTPPSQGHNLLPALGTRAAVLSLASNEGTTAAAALYRAVAPPSSAVLSLDGGFLPISEAAVVRNMRKLVEEGRWREALQILDRVPFISQIGLCAGVEASCAGKQWIHAVALLDAMASAKWSELEVAQILRVLFEASRRTTERTGAPAYASPILWSVGLDILRRYETGWALSRRSKLSPLFSSPAAVSNAIGLVGNYNLWNAALQLAERYFTGATPLPPLVASGNSSDSVSMDSQRQVRPNMVALTKLVLATRAKWEASFTLVARLVKHEVATVDSLDQSALEGLLHVCCRHLRWHEALSLLNVASERRRSVPLSEALCWRLLDMFGTKKQAAAVDMVSSVYLSRYSNPSRASRVYNAVLQRCATMSEVRDWRGKLNATGELLEENESLEKIVELYAKEADWCGALATCESLLCDPERRKLYLPTSQLHDWSQYALSTAATARPSAGGGPSWEVAVSLFSQMMDLQVPISEVSFRSVMKMCFLQGATAQANAVLQYTMKRGVGRN